MRVIKSFGLLRESWVGMAGAAIVIFWILVAIFAPVISPFDPNATLQPFASPGTHYAQGGTFWLGTDHIGRDILSRLIWASRTVLTWAPIATLTAYAVGIVLGLAAGYYRGWIDDVLSGVANIILSFPVLVLYILIVATIGASAINIVIAITFVTGPLVMRIVRGLVLDLRNRDYVAAAQTRGESAWRIMLVEILPNARGPLIVDACLRLGYVIITIGVLGFLGLGLPPPNPDWGGMINETRQMAMFAPWMTVFPCIAISSLILGFNLLADGLREISLRD
jgi:ABC-type dipeptide/oligopeptide/nickel transport system permease subunit